MALSWREVGPKRVAARQSRHCRGMGRGSYVSLCSFLHMGLLVVVQDMYGEVPIPSVLREGGNRTFDFLRRDLRRAGTLLPEG